MFIIFGSPRSGTTLLSASLNQNDHIVVPDETDFITPLSFLINTVKDEATGKRLIAEMIVSTERFKFSIGAYLSEREVYDIVKDAEYNIRSILLGIYCYIASKNNALIAGDKSPNDLMYLRNLVSAGLFKSDIKIVHIVRDVRDVILSIKNTGWDIESDIEFFFPRIWCDSNLYLQHVCCSEKMNYKLIKYEELICNPVEIFNELTDFLEAPFQYKMFDMNKRSERYANVRHHCNLKKDFMREHIALWKNSMDLDMVKLCEKQANEALEKFGY